MNFYLLFISQVTDIAKKAGEIWRGMTDKTEWEHKASAAKANYLQAVKIYEQNGGDPNAGKKRKQPSKKGSGKRSKKGASEEESE